MITKWKLFNFKSIKQETTLDFGPLTIFAGPNSGGKSTCIQSILLIAQTLRNQIGSRSVILNGPLTRLGQFNDLKTTGSDANQILVGWELRPVWADRLDVAEQFGSSEEEWAQYELEDASLRAVECEVAFDARQDVPTTQLNPQLFSTIIRATVRDADGIDHLIPFGVNRAPDAGESQVVKLRELGLSDTALDRVRPSISVRVEMDEESEQALKSRFVSGQPVGCELLHFLPQRIAVVYNRADDQQRILCNAIFNPTRMPIRLRQQSRDLYLPPAGLRVLRTVFRSQQEQLIEADTDLDRLLQADSAVLLATLLGAIRALPFNRRRQFQELLQGTSGLADQFGMAVGAELPDEFRTGFSSPSREVQVSCHCMRRFFSQAIKYLGPLRDEPKPLYPLAGGPDPLDVGLKGENTAAVLDLHKARLVRFIPPSAFAQEAVTATPIVRTLQVAVTEWLRYLGVAESVDSVDQGKLGHELKVTISKGSGQQDLTHVGVGVSQVLPILVTCLLADRDDALLFEQPELHLHPKVQTLLGDFFLSMALMNKQCIIETHSEYIISRLRFRAADAETDEIARKIKMYFVEKPEDDSLFRPIVVNEFGAINDWPEGFFDESQKEAEATLRAAMKKRREAQQRKS